MKLNLTVNTEEEESNMGFKDINGKTRFSLVSDTALEKIVRIREYGITKYGDNEGWKTVPEKEWVEAARRHIGEYFKGNFTDSESGLAHLHHAACSLILAMSKDIELTQDNLVRDIDDNWTLSEDVLLSNGIVPKASKISFKKKKKNFKCDETNDWCDNGACS